MDAYENIKAAFEKLQNQENAETMAKYMKYHFSFYGLPTPIRRSVYRDFLKEEKKKGIVDWNLLDRCYKDDHREFQYFVSDYLLTLERYLTIENLPKIKGYIQRKAWWDSVDAFNQVINRMSIRDQRIGKVMLKWAIDDDIWLRRIAIDHQLGRKEHTDQALLAKIIELNLNQEEFFINKAIGWSLREYSKTNSTWVKAFIEKHKEHMSPLSIREASKYI